MSVISLRLPEDLLSEVRSHSKRLAISPTEYMRQAIIQMNQKLLVERQKQKLQTASLKVRQESKVVNHEFSQIEKDPED